MGADLQVGGPLAPAVSTLTAGEISSFDRFRKTPHCVRKLNDAIRRTSNSVLKARRQFLFLFLR